VILAADRAGAPGPSLVDHGGRNARIISHEINFELILGGLIFVGVMCLLLAIVLRQRRLPKDGEPPPEDATGQGWVLLGGIALPLVVLTAVLAFTAHDLWAIEHAPSPVRTIEVVGHRWWWGVDYPGTGAATANELAVPVGQTVHMRLQTRDVAHSFWVPELDRKQDLIPGRVSAFDLTAERPGVYRGECAEFCGQQHANMTLRVEALAPAAFAAWLHRHAAPAHEPSTPSQRSGRTVFLDTTCAACHTIAGTRAAGQVGPDLTHFGSRAALGAGVLRNNRGNLGGWISDPQHIKHGALMPATALSGPQLQSLLDYLESLR
jgi:cytochrome c oxidase subunit 2